MANRVCWSCGTYTHMTPVQGSGQRIDAGMDLGIGRPRYRKQATFNCDQCHRLSIGEIVNTNDAYGSGAEQYIASEQAAVTWFPQSGTARDFPDVPEHVASAATEATLCLNLGAYRAAGSLARAVIEATAKEKEITTGNLWAKIDAMRDQGLIRAHIAEAAHEVRHLGNDMAHGDFADPVTEEEATEAVELMSEVLNEVFQSPARVERVKAARLAKKAGESGATG